MRKAPAIGASRHHALLRAAAGCITLDFLLRTRAHFTTYLTNGISYMVQLLKPIYILIPIKGRESMIFELDSIINQIDLRQLAKRFGIDSHF